MDIRIAALFFLLGVLVSGTFLGRAIVRTIARRIDQFMRWRHYRKQAQRKGE